MLGLSFGHYPKFVRSYDDLRTRAIDATAAFVADVRSGAFPGERETYHLTDEVAAELESGSVVEG
jgi:3-methyl-2-oxobutanoate hydroxymethyltransferase